MSDIELQQNHNNLVNTGYDVDLDDLDFLEFNETNDDISSLLLLLTEKSPEQIATVLGQMTPDFLSEYNEEILERATTLIENFVANGDFDNAQKIFALGGYQTDFANFNLLQYCSPDKYDVKLAEWNFFYGQMLSANYENYLGFTYSFGIPGKVADMETIFSFYDNALRNHYDDSLKAEIIANTWEFYNVLLDQGDVDNANIWNVLLTDLLGNETNFNPTDLDFIWSVDPVTDPDGIISETLYDPKLVLNLPDANTNIYISAINYQVKEAQKFETDGDLSKAYEKYNLALDFFVKIADNGDATTDLIMDEDKIGSQITQLKNKIKTNGETLTQEGFFDELAAFWGLDGSVNEGETIDLANGNGIDLVEVSVLKYQEIIDRYVEDGLLDPNSLGQSNTGSGNSSDYDEVIINRIGFAYDTNCRYEITKIRGGVEEKTVIHPWKQQIQNPDNSVSDMSSDTVYQLLHSDKVDAYKQNLSIIKEEDLECYDALMEWNDNWEENHSLKLEQNRIGLSTNEYIKNYKPLSVFIFNKFIDYNYLQNISNVSVGNNSIPTSTLQKLNCKIN